LFTAAKIMIEFESANSTIMMQKNIFSFVTLFSFLRIILQNNVE